MSKDDVLYLRAEWAVAFFQGQKEEFSYSHAQLEYLQKKLQAQQELMNSIKEEISDIVASWCSMHDIDNNATLTNIQKNILNDILFPIKYEEKMLELEIRMSIVNIQNVSKRLNNQTTTTAKENDDFLNEINSQIYGYNAADLD